jgi:ribosomal protein S27AE
MKQTMDRLFALQKLQLQTKALSLADEAEILKLRDKVPAPILAHFDRLIARGKKGVALARHGVCGECHLRISSGTLASLAYTNEIHICGNCGRYLFLAENEPPGLAEPPPPSKAPVKARAKGTRKKAALHAA